jgi:hypothetical protein
MRSYFYPSERLSLERPNTIEVARCKMSYQAFSPKQAEPVTKQNSWRKATPSPPHRLGSSPAACGALGLVIVCTATGEVYVGSSQVTSTRMSQHITNLRRRKHHNAGLQAAWNRYVEAAFRCLTVLTSPTLTSDELVSAEAAWMEALSAREPGLGFNRDLARHTNRAGRGFWTLQSPATYTFIPERTP